METRSDIPCRLLRKFSGKDGFPGMSWLFAFVPLPAGFFIDCLLGDPYVLPHPVRLIGRLIGRLISKLEGFVRRHFKRLVLGGAFLAVTVSLASALVPLGLLILCYRLHLALGIIAESILCYYLLAAKCLRQESMKVYAALGKGEIESARKAVSMIVGRDTAVLDESGIIRAAVETVAENTTDGVTAPLIFAAVGGAPLGFFYKAVNTMDSMIGYRNEKYALLGKFAARLDDTLNYFPSRLTALAMIASAFLLKLDGKNAFRIWRRDRRKHDSPNSAQTESVCAGALGIRLAGDAYYSGRLHKKEYIGEERRPIEREDIRRANRLMYAASVIILILFSALRILIFGRAL